MIYNIFILFVFVTSFSHTDGECHIHDVTSCLIEVKESGVPLNQSIIDVITNAYTDAKLVRLCRVYEKTKPCFDGKIYLCASQTQMSLFERIQKYYRLLCSKTSLPFQKMLNKYGKCLGYAMDNFKVNNCDITSSSSSRIKKCEELCDEDNIECQTKIEDSKYRLCEHNFVTEQCGSQASKFFDILKSTEYDDEYPINCVYKTNTAKKTYKDIVTKNKTKTIKVIKQRISNNIHETFKSLKTSEPQENISATTQQTTSNPILTMNPYHGAYVPFKDNSTEYQDTTTQSESSFLTTTIIPSTQSKPFTTTSIIFPQFVTSQPEGKLIFPNFVDQKTYSPTETPNIPSVSSQLTFIQPNPFNFTFKFNPNYVSSPQNDNPPKISYIVNVKENKDLKQFKETANTYVSTALDVIADKTQDLVKNAVVREVFATILRLSPEILNQN
uniref:Apple domain-containing protein n=1 Tax=Strongyloides venezuelensis TaxID=75913 RepID=A0A0K0FMY4_STRVS